MSTKPPARRPAVWTGFLRRFTDERALDLQETMRLQREVHSAWKRTIWADPNAPVGLANYVFEFIGKHENLPDSPPLRDALLSAITRVLERETAIFASADIDWKTAHLSLKDQVDLRRFLRAQQHFLANQDKVSNLLINTTATAFAHVLGAMPKVADITSSLSVPMVDLLSEPPGAIIERITATLIDEDVADAGLFTDLLNTLYGNRCRASGFAPHEDTRKSVIPATKSGLPTSELLPAYLDGTPFLELFNVPVPYAIPRKAFQAHSAMFAPSEHGKTQTIQHLIVEFLNEPNPPAMFIMDSMGAMLPKIQRLAIFEGRLKDRLVVLDPASPTPPALNFFKLSGGSPAQQMELLFYLFKALDQSLTARQRTTVTFLSQLMQKIDGTLQDLLDTCQDKKPRHPQAIQALPPIAQNFFLNSFYKPDTFMSQTKAQIVARLYTLASTPVFDMFSAKDNTFNAFDCIQQKKIVLVNTNRFAIGDEGSAIFGRFVLAQCLSAALARASVLEQDRHLALCIVDEAKQYVDENTEKFLADARQFGLGLFLATQYAQQLPEGVRRAIYGNTSIKFIGPIEYADRVSLAREMNTTPEFIGAMRAYDRSHTEWAVHVRSSNFTPSAVKVTVPYGTLENEPMMDDEAYQRVSKKASAPTKEELAPNTPAVETTPVEGEPWAIKPGQEW